MTDEVVALKPEYTNYIRSLVREPDLCASIRAWIEDNEESIQIAPEQGAFLAFVVRATGARKVLEIGSHVGYSGAWICESLGDVAGAEFTTIEIDPLRSDQTRQVLEPAFSDALDVLNCVTADAKEYLEDSSEQYDLVFIDSEKIEYGLMLALALPKLRVGGTLVVDNTLQRGRVLNPVKENSQVIAGLNSALMNGSLGAGTLVPIGDGMTLLTKREHRCT